jgi:hypothetical protein
VDSFDSVGGFASIGIDALDRPQISYIRQSDLAGSSGGALKFAIRLDAGWRTEFVDMIGPVAEDSWTSTSIYVDTSDNTHILYYDFSTDNFKYAFTAKWEYQVVGLVGTLSEPGNRNLALDSFGLPHIAFGGTSLYHGYFDGSLWQFELVDASPTAGGYASIAMDEDDNVYISYYDALAGSGDLKFAFLDKAAGFWTIETVDSTGDVGKFTSLALDDSNRPHIAYFDEDLDDLMYATKSGSSWNIDTVDDSSGAGGYPSIAVNSDGEPRIAYTDFVDEQLMYAIYNDDEWLTPRNIGYDGQVRSFISLSIDSWDLPHITFFEDQGEDPDENDNLMYAYHNGYSWTIDLIDRNDSVGWYNSMRLDSYNDIHVSYYDDSNGNLKYAYGSLFDWNDIVVDYGVLGTDDVGLFSSLYLDKADRPLFLYYDATNNVLRFAQRNLWDKQTVALSPAASFQEPGRPNLAVDVARRPHVVFGDTAIHYWFNDGFLWLENSPVDVANAGGYASVAVDSRGLPYVVYYDLNTEELKYNRQDGLGWLAAPVVIDSDDDVGKYASIAIEEFGPDVTVHVAYFDETNDTLKYARFNQNGGAINIEVVDDSSLVGSYPSLVLDGSGRPSISYYNIKDNNLKYAVRLGSDSWSTGTVISSGKVGLFSSLDLDSAGLPHIAFFDDDTDDLIYTWFNGYYWSFEVVDTYDSTGWYGSLQLDSNDQPHISYYDHSSQNLKHAFVYAHDWVTEIVDMAGDVGKYTSLQIDQSDGVHIVYYDTTTGSVKYVRGVDW